MMNPATYWRESKQWCHFLGKQGVVIEVTTLQVPIPSLKQQAPYQYALVEFEDQRQGFMVAAGDSVVAGDQVTTVLRRLEKPTKMGVIHYGIKLKKI